MATAEVDGDRLDDRDIVATASFLLFAGFETTVNLLGAGTEVLLRHPDQFAEVLADPELIPDMVEEALRYVSPVQYTWRTALAPIELPGGEVLDESDTIVLMIVGANPDPKVFEDPSRFDIHRPNARKHLACGDTIAFFNGQFDNLTGDARNCGCVVIGGQGRIRRVGGVNVRANRCRNLNRYRRCFGGIIDLRYTGFAHAAARNQRACGQDEGEESDAKCGQGFHDFYSLPSWCCSEV